jgi:ribosomal protein S18 acetylase RimI-like enzyme
VWREIDAHLCVFANGTGDLTLLIPPIAGDGVATTPSVLKQAFELMDDYNAEHGVPDRSRIEYVSEELLGRLDSKGLHAEPMGHDYLYETQRMIDLAGGDLKSKRQERNRFTRDNRFAVEPYCAERHLQPCLELLRVWKSHQDASHVEEANLSSIKRQKESLATELALHHAAELGLSGMVVYVDDIVRGFTFGEPLGSDQASIVIEKTDLSVKGLAQFIFSEFCRVNWADRPLINAGDDWGLESLAWTKQSYRPVKLLQKFVLCKEARAMAAVTEAEEEVVAQEPVASLPAGEQIAVSEIAIRAAKVEDLVAAKSLEEACFDAYRLSSRQLRYLQHCANAVFQVAERDGKVIGECIALIRHHKRGLSGRLYSLAVHPDYRGQGIGNQLLQMMLAELVSRGTKRIFLEVEQANQVAVKLYERHGFRQIGVLSDYYGEGRHGVHMVCELHIPTQVDARKAA